METACLVASFHTVSGNPCPVPTVSMSLAIKPTYSTSSLRPLSSSNTAKKSSSPWPTALKKAITKLPARTENGAVFPFAARFGYAERTKARDPYYLYPYEKPLEVCIFVKSDSPSNADLDMNTTTNTTMNTIVKDSHHDMSVHDMSVKYNLNPSETSNHNAKQPEQGQGEYICTAWKRVRMAIMARRPIPKRTTEAVLMLNIIILFSSTWYGLDPDGMPHMASTNKDRVRKVVLETLIETLYHEAYE